MINDMHIFFAKVCDLKPLEGFIAERADWLQEKIISDNKWTTPIVVDNKVNRNFFNLGVPMVMLESWEEFKDLSINDLDEINERNKNKNFKEFVSFDYWEKQILSKKLVENQ